MGRSRNIYITNPRVETILANSRNASRLIEEAIIFYEYAYRNDIFYDREHNRVNIQKLIQK